MKLSLTIQNEDRLIYGYMCLNIDISLNYGWLADPTINMIIVNNIYFIYNSNHAIYHRDLLKPY